VPGPAPADVVRLLFEARAAGDQRGVLALLDPEIEAQAETRGASVKGVAAVRRMFGRESADGARVEVDAHRIEAHGEDAVLVFGRVRVISGGSLSDSPGAWRFTVRAGRVKTIAPVIAGPAALRQVA
jgi:ketosteroid isomerase-like protein